MGILIPTDLPRQGLSAYSSSPRMLLRVWASVFTAVTAAAVVWPSMQARGVAKSLSTPGRDPFSPSLPPPYVHVRCRAVPSPAKNPQGEMGVGQVSISPLVPLVPLVPRCTAGCDSALLGSYDWAMQGCHCHGRNFQQGTSWYPLIVGIPGQVPHSHSPSYAAGAG